MEREKTIIFDLDGTLALIDERRALSAKPNGKINWKTFFDPNNIKLDKPNWPVISMFISLKKSGYRVGVFSGRDSISYDKTYEWLTSYGIEPDFMRMRPQGSFTPDDTLKKEWLDQEVEDGHEIMCVFDDRDKVVKMWRENGISCFQVAEGSF